MPDKKKLTLKSALFPISFSLFIILSTTLITVICLHFFNQNWIYKNVLKQKHYELQELQKPMTFTARVKPEWIPTGKGEVLKPKEEIAKVDQVTIILESVLHRGNDIYFNFDAIPDIRYKSGQFLSNYELEKDGTATSYSLANGFHLYSADQTAIEVGQRGWGPDAKFSFGVAATDYDQIKVGFTFEYQGSILYGYTLTD